VAVAAAMDTRNIAAQGAFPEKIGEVMQLRLHVDIFAKHIQRYAFSKAGTVVFQVIGFFPFVCNGWEEGRILPLWWAGMN